MTFCKNFKKIISNSFFGNFFGNFFCNDLLKNKKGYTLVEIMTAAAIVAVLAAIAIPNYLSYTASGRQAEAKIALSNIYGAEMNYAAESGFYSACLTQLGYIPAAGDTRYYSAGFTEATATAASCGSNGNTGCNYYTPPAAASCSCVAGGIAQNTPIASCNYAYVATARGNSGVAWQANASLQSALATAGASMGSTAFSASAAGSISGTSTTPDYWWIHSNKTLVHSQSGI